MNPKLPIVHCALAALAAAQGGSTIFVTTTSDSTDFGGGQTVADLPGPDGRVSMREAVTAVNNTPGPQTIGFQIPVSDWGLGTVAPRIRNEGSAWALTDPGTTIDGTTQTAFTGDTNPNGYEVMFMNAHPSYLGASFFYVTTTGCTFRALDQMLNRGYGVDLQGDGNTVVGNRISGLLYAAVRIEGNVNVVGGVAPADKNELSSGNDGVRIEGTAAGNVVIGNFLHGSVHGLQIRESATGNRVGGFLAGEANWFSETGHSGEHGYPIGSLIELGADGNEILGNLIGTNDIGTGPGDSTASVAIELNAASGNTIEGNVIGGMSGSGIHALNGSSGNTIRGNWIGVDATGQVPISNHTGIHLSGFDYGNGQPTADNAIEDNVIAHNSGTGVLITIGQQPSLRNRVTGNVIRDNGGQAIDLGGDGPTANDPGDLDGGANDLMNNPVFTIAYTSSGQTYVTGTLDTPAPDSVTVELFANPAPSFGVEVEAVQLVGSIGPAGDGSFAAVLPVDLAGQALTATATDVAGNTSELSSPIVVLGPPWQDLGQGMGGTFGVPQLQGDGPLLPGTQLSLDLSGAHPFSTGVWVVGYQQADLPFATGVVVPSPDHVLPLSTDGNGEASAGGQWWTGATSGWALYFQAWVFDFGAPALWTASNGLVGTTP
jgi:hypothetical protein